jgi:hypothetical protein
MVKPRSWIRKYPISVFGTVSKTTQIDLLDPYSPITASIQPPHLRPRTIRKIRHRPSINHPRHPRPRPSPHNSQRGHDNRSWRRLPLLRYPSLSLLHNNPTNSLRTPFLPPNPQRNVRQHPSPQSRPFLQSRPKKMVPLKNYESIYHCRTDPQCGLLSR